MNKELWNKIKPVVAYLSLLLNTALTGSWIYVFQNSKDHLEATSRYDRIWMIDSGVIMIIAIVLGVFSVIYFARTNGFLNKLLMVIQILFICWFLFTMM